MEKRLQETQTDKSAWEIVKSFVVVVGIMSIYAASVHIISSMISRTVLAACGFDDANE